MLVRNFYNAVATIVMTSFLAVSCGQQFGEKHNDDKVVQNQITPPNGKITTQAVGAQGEFYGTISVDNKGACTIQSGNVGELLTCGSGLNDKNQTTINLTFSSLGLKNAPTCTYGVFSPINRLPSIDKLTSTSITLSFAGSSTPSQQPQCSTQPCCQQQPCAPSNCCAPSFPQPQPLPPPPWSGCQSNCGAMNSNNGFCPPTTPYPAPSPCGCQPQQPPCNNGSGSTPTETPLQLLGQTLTFHCDIAE